MMDQVLWNGYTVDAYNYKFTFDCRYCAYHIDAAFKNVAELKTVREVWKKHVALHGGPYGQFVGDGL